MVGGEGGFYDEYRRARWNTYRRFNSWIEGHETLARFGAAFGLAIATGLLAQVGTAHIRVFTDLTPVPFTMQVFGVGLMGALLGRKWGAISGGIYVLMAFAGVPVLAGQAYTFESFEAFSGWMFFTSGLTAGYVLCYPLQAYLIGAVMERRGESSRRSFLVGTGAAGIVLLTFVLLDVYFLVGPSGSLFYPSTEMQRVFLGILVGTLIVVTGACAWLGFTTRARRERIELFMANVVALLVLYLVAAAWFFVMWHATPGETGAARASLDVLTTLRWTVLPFIGFDLLKILAVIGLVTLVRPTRKELQTWPSSTDARAPPAVPHEPKRSHVR